MGDANDLTISSIPSNDNLHPLQSHARKVIAATEVISSYCASEGLPHPSFDCHAPTVTIPSTAPLAVQNARQTVINSATVIQRLVTEPAEYLPNLAIHYQLLSCTRWLCNFHILTHIPLEGCITYSDLASVAGVPLLQLKSIIRMAITSSFLCEPKPDNVSHNAVSTLFATTPSVIDWVKFMTEFSMPAAAAFVEATEKYGETAKKNETAFNIATRTDGSLFEYFAQSPERANQFAGYMKSVQNSYGTSLKHLVAGFDWGSFGNATVVDVGGSTCSSCIALAEAFPQLRFIVQDLPDTISNSAAILSAQPDTIRMRITAQSYDIFNPQPVKDADVYLLRMILHDWPAAEAQAILKNHLEPLKANSRTRLVIMDTVLPPPGSTGVVEEALLRVRDLTMIQAFNSKERELQDFVDLFTRVEDGDGCLVLRKMVKPPGSVMSVLEVVYQTYEDGHQRSETTLNDGKAAPA